jgi:peptidoglycan hydrolase-like protein with peptidoglycan-binding domain
VSPGELPPEWTFGRNLIGYSAEHEARLQVAKAQSALLQLGYRVGKVDGKYGAKTKAGVKAFQREHHHRVDGKIDEKLLKQLEIAVKNLSSAMPSQPQ